MRANLLVIAATLAVLGDAVAQVDAGPSPWSPRARAEVFATLVVHGKIRVRDADSLDRAIRNGGGYVELDVRVREVLKGACGEQVRVTVFAAPRGHPHGYSPSAEDIRRQIGGERILLLHRVGRRTFLADRFHGVALLPATRHELAEIQALIAYHAILSETDPPAKVRHADEVTGILEDIASNPAEEKLAFARLQALGAAAIPAIVRHLDDQRPIHEPEIVVFRREADAEGPFRPVRARQFRDALFAVLQELADTNLGMDPDRASEDRRKTASSRWRVYSHYLIAASTTEREVHANSRR